MSSEELNVTWAHDRLRVVVPIDRKRMLPWVLLAAVVVLAGTLLSTGAVCVVVLVLVLPLTFLDRREISIEMDHRWVVVRYSYLFRPRVERLALVTLRVDTSRPELLVLCSAAARVEVQWHGSPASLQWLVDELAFARQGAMSDPPEPPAELDRLRRRTIPSSV